MSAAQGPATAGEEADTAELLALTKRMRAVSDATYWLFFSASMGADVHAFIEFCGVLSKYVDICERSAARGIDFRCLNTHSGAALPVEAHDMEYLGEKLDCILGPAIRANPAAKEALRKALFGDEPRCRVCGTANVLASGFDGERCGYCVAYERNRQRASGASAGDWAKPADQPATGPLRRKLALARGVLNQVNESLLGLASMPTCEELDAIVEETADP